MAFFELGKLGEILRQSPFVDARNIRGGFISAQEIVLAGGTHGVIRSHNYDPTNELGWAVFGDGSASFYGTLTIGVNAVILGDILSGNWDGANPVNLASFDATATAGLAIDSSVGAMQISSALYVGLDNSYLSVDVADWVTDRPRIQFNANGEMVGEIYALNESGNGGLYIKVPDIVGHTANDLTLEAEDSIYLRTTSQVMQADGSTIKFGDGTTTGYPMLDVDSVGSASAPAYTFIGDSNSGIYRVAADELGVATGGVQRLLINSNGLDAVSGTVSLPSYSFLSDPDTGGYLHATNRMGFAGGGTLGAIIDANGIQVADGSKSTPSIGFHQDGDNGFYRSSADQVDLIIGGKLSMRFNSADTIFYDPTTEELVGFFDGSVPAWRFFADGSTTGNEDMRLVDGGAGSSLFLNDGLTDVGNHETLRLDRGTGGTLRAVGYYSSWKKTKTEIQPLGRSKYWNRDWFRDIETFSSRKKKDTKYFRELGYDMRTLSFMMDNLIKNTNLLTTKGEQVGGEPDLHAILAVTVDFVQSLEKRLVDAGVLDY